MLIVALGYVAVLRDAARKRDGLAVLAPGVAGCFLALGSQGPTGGLFRLAYEHVPGFVIMREPDKFAVLVALAYAYGFGWGVAWLTTGSRQKVARVAPAALAIALPLAYTPNLLGGLGGQVKASELPSSWSFASRLTGHATVLCRSRRPRRKVRRPGEGGQWAGLRQGGRRARAPSGLLEPLAGPFLCPADRRGDTRRPPGAFR